MSDQLCDDVTEYSNIKSRDECRIAGLVLGFNEIQERFGPAGCWTMPNINPTTVFWGKNAVQQCVKNIRYICQKGTSNNELTPAFVSSNCFSCPGNSVNGPETGACTTCFGNNIKLYTKNVIKKIVQNNLPAMTSGTDKLVYDITRVNNIEL